MKTFIDTNVFLYAAGSPYPQREGCSRVLRKVADGSLEATSKQRGDPGNPLPSYSGAGRREDASDTRISHLLPFPGLLPVTRDDIQKACDLLRRYPGLAVRDAIHAATMLQNGLHQIISVDPDFDQIDEIRRIDPH